MHSIALKINWEEKWPFAKFQECFDILQLMSNAYNAFDGIIRAHWNLKSSSSIVASCSHRISIQWQPCTLHRDVGLFHFGTNEFPIEKKRANVEPVMHLSGRMTLNVDRFQRTTNFISNKLKNVAHDTKCTWTHGPFFLPSLSCARSRFAVNFNLDMKSTSNKRTPCI